MADDFVSGRQLDTKTKDGKTALQLLISTDPFAQRELQRVKDLISRDGNRPGKEDIENKTPLVAMASRLSNDPGNLDLRRAMRTLLDRGVNQMLKMCQAVQRCIICAIPSTLQLPILQAIVIS